jgi:hypothetical protein
VSGISPVYSVRHVPGPYRAKVLGLTTEAIQTDVELKLRLAGMRVVKRNESVQIPGTPYVYVTVNVSKDAKAASVEVILNQNATLERNGEFVFGVTTWSSGGLISNPNEQFIRGQIKDTVDEFLNAWLSVNPKK